MGDIWLSLVRCAASNRRAHGGFSAFLCKTSEIGDALAAPRSLRVEAFSGMTAKNARVGAMHPPHRYRRELTCRVRPRNFDFLSVGEEFGADALGEYIAR